MPNSEAELQSLELDAPPTAPPPLSGVLRATPEDFEVEELPICEPDGQGEHLWLWVRKRDLNTPVVARELARRAGVKPFAVSFAGMKDRRAVTTQWFSLHLPGQADPSFEGDWLPGAEVLRAVRHSRKLQRGALRGNRFRLVLREVTGDPDAFAARWRALAQAGVPNYFGEQRFGADAGNLAQARHWFAGGRAPRDRDLRGLLLSSVRGGLFNAVLAERVRRGDWCRLLPGELAMLDGSHSLFQVAAVDAELSARVDAGDVHPTGPLVGAPGKLEPTDLAQTVEQTVLAQWQGWVDGLEREGLTATRRALRLPPRGLSVEWLDVSTLALGFTLPAGAYATVVLRELVDYREPDWRAGERAG
ncbi:MAG: tRNA pseudouridine(13) synthase TruD [Thiotrichales bacterium]